jgi:hypothetical protein
VSEPVNVCPHVGAEFDDLEFRGIEIAPMKWVLFVFRTEEASWAVYEHREGEWTLVTFVHTFGSDLS